MDPLTRGESFSQSVAQPYFQQMTPEVQAAINAQIDQDLKTYGYKRQVGGI